jgi:tRNA-specific 2-thiouridylase
VAVYAGPSRAGARPERTMKREGIVVGMSGGVDSSTAVRILCERGYRVIGVTLRFFCYTRARASARPCCSDALLRRARQLCARLGIEHHVIDAEAEFSEKVVSNFIDEYRAGRTPNPCIVCNEKVKFPALLRVADWLGCDRIATGHYAKLLSRDAHGKRYLAAGSDGTKDQSYFLYRVPVGVLMRTIFPLGELSKEVVRRWAPALGCGHERALESQDVCFIPEGNLKEFLCERIGCVAGDVVDEEGHVLGTHEGAHLYTVGQRRGLGVAGGAPRYVAAIDASRNRVVLAARERVFHAGALCGSLKLRRRDIGLPCKARVRHRRPLVDVIHIERRGKTLLVRFREPQWAVTPGQSLVLYENGVVVGGGIIEQAL